MSQKNSQTQLIAVASITILALLGIIGWLYYNNSQQDKLIEKHKLEIDEQAQVKAELEKEYYEALADLEELRGDNTELNAMIETQKEELKKQKDQISGLLTSSRNLAAAREEIKMLKEQAGSALAELTKLREENQMLAANNQQLSQEKEILTDEVTTQRQMNDELLTVKAALIEEKEGLTEEKNMLSKKVTRASVINVTDIDVQGYKLKGSGKEVKKGAAKNVDLLKICFKANENAVSDPGNEEFYIRIINPKGETIQVENLGSGIITNVESGDEVAFTKSKELMYTGTDAMSCLSWQSDNEMEKGLYAVEVYNKGYLAGKSTFKLN
jgi:myosin heavy subunit